MTPRITVLPRKLHIDVPSGSNLLEVLRASNVLEDAPCGGNGTCGKCRVTVNGESRLACQTTVDQDMTVTVNSQSCETAKPELSAVTSQNNVLAFDIGTTTVVGYLLDRITGKVLACDNRRNPQCAYGADVISRIHYAVKNDHLPLTRRIRQCMDDMIRNLCSATNTSPAAIDTVSIVGNPAMQQLFLGISPDLRRQ